MDDGRRLERFAWALLASEFGLDPTKRFERTEDPFGTRGPFPLLHDACRVGDEEMVAYLVEMGCDPMEFDAEGLMPHHHAASSSDGTVAILQLVLARCPSTVVNMEARDGWRHGYTALQLAVEKGSLETVKFLVGAGADVRRPCVLVDGEARRLSEVAASKHPHHAALMIGWIDD